MDSNLLLDISDFFDELDDAVNDFVDRIEIEPIRLYSDVFITGLKRIPTTFNSFEAHLKQIQTIRLDDGKGNVTYTLASEPDGELWFNCNMFADTTLKAAFKNIKETFALGETYHFMSIDYNDKDSSIKKNLNVIYHNKRAACKEALQLKKKYENVKVKFQIYKLNMEGLLEETDKEPTDFEIATAAAD
jgi:hypothetical protein